MKKINFVIPQGKFGTIKSKYQPESNYISQDEFTAGSYNFITNATGALEKRPTDVKYTASDLSGPGKDQFEAIFANGVHHFLFMVGGTLNYTSGDQNIHSVASGYTAIASMEYAMYQNRVYFDNGVDAASVYDLTSSYGGVSYTPPQVKPMGAQTPSSAPTFNADSSGGSVPAGGHTYKVTFLYYGFEESNGGPASSLHTVSNPNNTVNLKTIPIGGYGVTARKIYRDNNDGNYLLVGTISDNTTTTFVDTVSAGTTPIPVANNTPPVFSYIVLNLSRLFVAGVSGTPTTLYWSNPGLPDIFDPNNFVVCNPRDPIQALAVYQGTVYVLNRHSFGQILGNTDDTFFYQEFPGSVGCVDNRSIQVRTINGVPVLIWLSDRGLYAFNGSSVEYISDAIEDLVNLNLQQVNFVTNSNSQSTQADFEAGTSSPAIDLVTDPGEITTINPKAVFQSEADWEAGSLTNLSTADGSNSLKVPLAFTPTAASGTLSGSAIVAGSNIVLSTSAAYTGEDHISGLNPLNAIPTKVAFSFTIPRSGTLSHIKFDITINTAPLSPGLPDVFTVQLYNNSFGQPGSNLGALYTANFSQTGGIMTLTADANVSASLSPGTYWFVIFATNNSQNYDITAIQNAVFNGGTSLVFRGAWVAPSFTNTSSSSIDLAFSFVSTPVSASGTWQSAIYDSESISSAVSNTVVNTGAFPTGCSATLFVDMSNDPAMATGITTFLQSNPNGTYSPALSNNRYWRLRYSLATTDNTVTPTLSAPILNFVITSTWISTVIDCTTDVTSYNALILTESVPAGTSITITVATSDDNITYTSYGPVGSALVKRYVKVKAVLIATSDDLSTPSLSFLEFSWNITATFISSIINVGQVPSGWGLFQDVAALNGGTLTFYIRSASSSGAISSATFYTVANGTFPNMAVLPLQYVQWKIVFTSAPDKLPTVDSVTINWFLGNNQSPIRAASLFFNKTYYLAVAELNQTTNNIVIVFDFEGNWRVFRNITINSLGLFYNQPFYCDAVRPNIYQWLVAPNGAGSSITMDVRTKYFSFNEPDHLKNPRSLRVIGLNTGTTIHAYYSVNRGVTWIEMLNTMGATGFTTTTDGNKFSEYFVPDYNLGNDVSGVNVMFRVTSTDAFPCTIMALGVEVIVRAGHYIGVTND